MNKAIYVWGMLQAIWAARQWLDADARLQHLHIIGRTGTGKTTLLHNLLAQDIYIGNGAALLDPHGDLAFDILDAIPRARTRQVIYFNPSDLRAAILGNTIAFRIGGEDAEALAREFDSTKSRQFLEADRYHAHARLLRDGTPYEYHLTTEPLYQLCGGHRTNIITQSAECFGYAAENVERETAHYFR